MHSIDITRGIASIFVFLTHLGNDLDTSSFFHPIIQAFLDLQEFFLWCNGGLHWAVIVFIVLSGFCIHMPNAMSRSKKIDLFDYYRRRFFRIYPVMVIAILIGYFVHSVCNTNAQSYLTNLFGNLSLLSSVSSEFPAPIGNTILLTVVAECILYLVYPLCLPKNKNHWILFLCGVLLVYVVNFSFLLTSNIDPVWLQRNAFSFLLYWWIGALSAELAFNQCDLTTRLRTLSNSKTLIAVLLTYVVYVVFCMLVQFKGAHVFKSVYLALMAGLFLLIGADRDMGTQQIGRMGQILTKIGEHSYSLYAVHFPVITLLSYAATGSKIEGSILFYISNIIAVAMASYCLYRFVEKPSHKFARASRKSLLRQESQ